MLPPSVLFHLITKGWPAVRVSLPIGVVKEFTAKAVEAEAKASRTVENCIVERVT